MTPPTGVCLIAFSSSASTARTESFGIRPDGRRVEPSKLPATLRGRPPPADNIQREPVERDQFGIQEVLVLSRRDDEQPFAQAAEPVHLGDYHLDVAQFVAAGQVAGKQLGVGEGDRDGGAQMMRGILEKPALGTQQADVLLADKAPFMVGGNPAVSVPHDRYEHRRHERYLGHLLDRFVNVQHIQADPGEGGDDHDPEPPHHRVDRPDPEPVERRETDRDEVERDRIPGWPYDDCGQVQQ